MISNKRARVLRDVINEYDRFNDELLKDNADLRARLQKEIRATAEMKSLLDSKDSEIRMLEHSIDDYEYRYRKEAHNCDELNMIVAYIFDTFHVEALKIDQELRNKYQNKYLIIQHAEVDTVYYEKSKKEAKKAKKGAKNGRK